MKIKSNTIESILDIGTQYYNVDEDISHLRVILFITESMYRWKYVNDNYGYYISKSIMHEHFKNKVYRLYEDSTQ